MDCSVSLLKAVADSDHQLVESLIDIGAEINCRSSDGDTPLHLAVSKGLTNIALLLINNGSDINSKNRKDKTPLFIAAESNNLTVVKVLLNKGNLNVNLYCCNKTALHIACEEGHGSIVKEFVNNYRTMFWINMRYLNDLPIHVAICKGYSDLTLTLLDKFTSVNSLNKFGQTPLWCALLNGHSDLLQILLKNYRVNLNIRYEGNLPLFYAIENHMIKEVMLLIENGSNVLARNSDKRNVLHMCALKSLPELINIFLEKGVDLSAVDSEGFTPFHYAVSQSNLDVINIFLTKGVDLEHRVGDIYNGLTPLQIAVKNNNLVVAKLLVDNGADINARDPKTHFALNKGGTLLHWVCRWPGKNNPALLRFLIQNGANINSEASDGRTPLCLAVKHCLPLEDLKYMIDNGACLNTSRGGTPLYWAFYMRYDDVAHYLIENGTDVNWPIDNFNDEWSRNCSPLHKVSNLSVAKLLISKGANVNALDLDGNTPLHQANNVAIAKCLLDSGADPTICNFQGDTPLHTAKSALISELMIKKGIPVNMLNHKGYSPLHVAKNVQIAQILVENGADVNIVSKEGYTVLHSLAVDYWSYSMSSDLVDYFIDKGVDPNAVDNSGNSPLKLCSLHHNYEVPPKLLNNGATLRLFNVDTNGYNLYYMKWLIELFTALKSEKPMKKSLDLVRSHLPLNYKEENTKSTALHVAAQYGHEKFVELVLNKLPKNAYSLRYCNRININAQDVDGFTPLHCAALKNDIAIVKSILHAGAMYNAKSFSGLTPFDLTDNTDIKALLKEVEKAFDAIKSHDVQTMTLILEKEICIINALNDNGCSLLHEACLQGFESAIILLLSKEADVTLLNNKRETVLQLAASVKNLRSVILFLEKIIQKFHLKHYNTKNISYYRKNDYRFSFFNDFINVRNLDDRTALHIASDMGSFDIVKTLIRIGVMVDAKDKFGMTAAELSNDESIKSILQEASQLFLDAGNGNNKILNNLKNDLLKDNVFTYLTTNKFGCSLTEYLDCNGFNNIAKEIDDSNVLSLPEEFNLWCGKQITKNDSDSEDDLGFGLFD